MAESWSHDITTADCAHLLFRELRAELHVPTACANPADFAVSPCIGQKPTFELTYHHDIDAVLLQDLILRFKSHFRGITQCLMKEKCYSFKTVQPAPIVRWRTRLTCTIYLTSRRVPNDSQRVACHKSFPNGWTSTLATSLSTSPYQSKQPTSSHPVAQAPAPCYTAP